MGGSYLNTPGVRPAPVSPIDGSCGSPARRASALHVAATRQKHLVLILAREFASTLATPTLLTDERGLLVFYNEAAEEILERPFSEARELHLDQRLRPFPPRTLAYGRVPRTRPLRGGPDPSRRRPPVPDPVPLERLPTEIALYERRPAHERFTITSVD